MQFAHISCKLQEIAIVSFPLLTLHEVIFLLSFCAITFRAITFHARQSHVMPFHAIPGHVMSYHNLLLLILSASVLSSLYSLPHLPLLMLSLSTHAIARIVTITINNILPVALALDCEARFTNIADFINRSLVFRMGRLDQQHGFLPLFQTLQMQPFRRPLARTRRN